MSNLPDSIGQPAWMTLPATVAVIEALEAKGFAGCARFVGGCVRNTLLKTDIDDVDIATTLTPDQVTEALEQAGLKAVPTGVDHGTVTAVSQGRPYEITTLRKDVSTDGRRAVVSFTKSWAEDAERRDFRLNALYADADGRLFDPTGEGIADCLAGRIVFVGDPMTRIREDYLRILRWFRFHAWYGKGDPDQAALTACKALKGMLSGRAAERTQKELLKLLAAEDPRAALRLMAATSVLSSVLPQVKALTRFEALVGIQTEQLFETDAELRLAALLPDDAVVARDTAERLRLSNALKDRLIEAAGKEPRIVSWMSPREARRTVYRIGMRAFSDRIKLAWAASTRPSTTSQWRGLLALAETWTPPAFPLTGEEVLAAGVPKGPLVGEVMREVEEWWIDQDFMDDKLAAVERLKAVAQGMCY
ncbi:CCA tRNA nucleotidyltransferase [Caulobacter sp. NIBR1757]|uniref:CCA tRNA nucleotidyltransferase n=1 Tax=Caulobacter sp. NIBR1757 TaxID=3016000 RepID=UPI0022F05753|nr:CCA tRNA nucleotidyltransferase [Caulobacter sp. NIBR1757]WGM38058.1 CCA-adding enzyme [Caulobacter sp. NIBR1757]